ASTGRNCSARSPRVSATARAWWCSNMAGTLVQAPFIRWPHNDSVFRERTMQKVMLPFKLALACTLFAACVTINVYFPAAAAEKAADQIIDQVTGTATTTGKAEPQMQRAEPSLLRSAAAAVLDTLVPAAHAQEAPNL